MAVNVKHAWHAVVAVVYPEVLLLIADQVFVPVAVPADAPVSVDTLL